MAGRPKRIVRAATTLVLRARATQAARHPQTPPTELRATSDRGARSRLGAAHSSPTARASSFADIFGDRDPSARSISETMAALTGAVVANRRASATTSPLSA